MDSGRIATRTICRRELRAAALTIRRAALRAAAGRRTANRHCAAVDPHLSSPPDEWRGSSCRLSDPCLSVFICGVICGVYLWRLSVAHLLRASRCLPRLCGEREQPRLSWAYAKCTHRAITVTTSATVTAA